MATNLPISGLPELQQAPAGSSQFAIVEGGVTHKITVANLTGPYLTTGSQGATQNIYGFLQWYDNAGNDGGFIGSYNTEVGSIYLNSQDGSSYVAVYNDGISLLGNITASGTISASGDLLITNITASGDISASGYISGSDLVITGNTTLGNEPSTDKVKISSSLEVSGSLISFTMDEGNFPGKGAIQFTGSTDFSRDITVQDDLRVKDETNLEKETNIGYLETETNFITSYQLNVTASSNNSDSARFDGGVLITGSLTASSDVSASGAIYTNTVSEGNIVDGLTLIGNVTASNNISASGDIIGATGSFHHVTGSFESTGSFGRLLSHTIGGLSPVSITDDTQITGSLVALGDISASANLFSRTLSIANNADPVTTISNTGDISSSGDLVVRNITASGDISASGELLVDNNITATGNLIIEGNSTLGDDTTDVQTLIGRIVMSGSFEMTGSASTSGSFKMQGDRDTASDFKTLEITGSTEISNDLRVKDSATIDTQLNTPLIGNAIEDTIVAINQPGGIVVTGGIYTNLMISASGNISTSADLISRNITASGDISASGTITANNFVGDGSTINVGTSANRIIYTGPNGLLTEEAGFEYDPADDRLTVNKITTVEFTSSFVTSSQIFSSGSNLLGDDTTDVQTLIGSIMMSGSFEMTGSASTSGSFKMQGDGDTASDFKTLEITGSTEISNDLTVKDSVTVDTQLSTPLIANANNDIIVAINQPGGIVVTGGIFTNEMISASGNISTSADLETRNITASGDISASGFLIVDKIFAGDSTGTATQTLLVNTEDLFHRGSTLRTSGAITASGDVSASFESTGSFGRLLSHTIGGLSPISLTDDTQITGSLVVTEHITASGNISIVGDIAVTNITASGDISASGDIITSRYRLEETDSSVVNLAVYDEPTTAIRIGDNLSGTVGVSVFGNLTASNDISASGDLEVRNITSQVNISAGFDINASRDTTVGRNLTVTGNISNNANTTFGNSASDMHTFTGAISASSDISTSADLIVRNITASGDVSSSGDLFANNATIDTQLSTPLIANANNDIIVTVAEPGGITVEGGIYTDQMISASGNISTSADLIARTITASSDISSSARIIANNFVGDGSTINVGTSANRIIYTGANGLLTEEAGFEYDVTDNRLTVDKITTVEFTSSFVTSSQIFSSGSNLLGDDTTDVQTLIGSIMMSGSAQLTGSLYVDGSSSFSGDVSASGKIISTEFALEEDSSGPITFARYDEPTNAIRFGNNLSSTIGVSIFANITASRDISASNDSTGSFGRLLSHTIGGLSPISLTDNTSVTGSLFVSNNLEVLGTIQASSISSSNDLIVRNITASGTISASGTLFADRIYGRGNIGGSDNRINLDTSNRIDLTPNNVTAVRLSDSAVILNKPTTILGNTSIDGALATTGNISASGNIISSKYQLEVENSSLIDFGTYDDNTNAVRIGDINDIVGVRIYGNITASNNISASGNIIVNEVTASGQISSSQTITAKAIAANTFTDYAGGNIITDDGSDLTIENRNLTSEGTFTSQGMTSTSFITSAGNISASGTLSTSGSVTIAHPTNPQIIFKENNLVSGGVETTSGALIFKASSGISRMTVRSTGQVGIGTLTPSQKLTVAGDISASLNIYADLDVIATGSVLSNSGFGLSGSNKFFEVKNSTNVKVVSLGSDLAGNGALSLFDSSASETIAINKAGAGNISAKGNISSSGAVSASSAITAQNFITKQNNQASTGNSAGTALDLDIERGGFFAITNGTNNSGVKLQSLLTFVDGTRVDIVNLSLTNSLKVYPFTGQAIGTLAVNAPATLAGGEMLTIYRISDDQWFGSIGKAIS